MKQPISDGLVTGLFPLETVHFQKTTFQVQSKVTNIQFNYYLSKYGTEFHLMLTQQN